MVRDQIALRSRPHHDLTGCHMLDLTRCHMLDLTVEGSIARPKRNAERAALADRVSVGVNHLHDVPVAMTRRDLVVASGGLIETSPCDGGSFPAISAAPEDVAGCRIRRRRAPLARHPDRRIGDCRVKLGGTTFASMPVTAKMIWDSGLMGIFQKRRLYNPS